MGAGRIALNSSSFEKTDDGNRQFSIGEAAERLGVSVHTLRYYERTGLLQMVPRKRNGHRLYGAGDFHWISLLLCLRASGMPIADLRRFSEMIRRGEVSIPDRIEFLQKHREKLDADMKTLRAAMIVVDEKLKKYRKTIT